MCPKQKYPKALPDTLVTVKQREEKASMMAQKDRRVIVLLDFYCPYLWFPPKCHSLIPRLTFGTLGTPFCAQLFSVVGMISTTEELLFLIEGNMPLTLWCLKISGFQSLLFTLLCLYMHGFETLGFWPIEYSKLWFLNCPQSFEICLLVSLFWYPPGKISNLLRNRIVNWSSHYEK